MALTFRKSHVKCILLLRHSFFSADSAPGKRSRVGVVEVVVVPLHSLLCCNIFFYIVRAEPSRFMTRALDGGKTVILFRRFFRLFRFNPLGYSTSRFSLFFFLSSSSSTLSSRLLFSFSSFFYVVPLCRLKMFERCPVHSKKKNSLSF